MRIKACHPDLERSEEEVKLVNNAYSFPHNRYKGATMKLFSKKHMDRQQAKVLINSHFSLQWCRENLVLPIGTEKTDLLPDEHVVIAIGSVAYLGTIGEFVAQRLREYKVKYVQIEPETIQQCLDEISSLT